ncbi:AzlC family ABC transporter permease [Mycetocola reblochoni]|uniref:Branched-chain amino acid ABC transporter permease n=2 Tax=Mycetocola reblochoni TaxID=331618 RepID=A0A3L6ZLR5_9MICO|nr:AzlC family ABC transporter permease [Mycetocola reblochoni]RLP68605.1 branched-chain amino acid ABC transporter permease [Mycetocola reblochoni]SJN33480.1 putative branched-chain amino acid transporter [Mycetocola reblochoni REB411]
MPPEPPATAPLTLPTGVPLAAETTGSPFRDAVVDARGAGLAMLPIGLAFGVLVTQSGLDWWWATVFASVVYAGSLEFLLVGLVAVAAPLSQIAVTALLVNSRHVFYALSFPLHEVRGTPARVYSTFALTDEAYAITAGAAPRRLGTARIIWIQVILHVLWVAGATAGALAGAALPVQLPGVGFALTALFTVLSIEAFRARHDIPTPVLAIVCGAVAMLLTPDNMLLVGTSLFAAATIARLLLRRRRGGSSS